MSVLTNMESLESSSNSSGRRVRKRTSPDSHSPAEQGDRKTAILEIIVPVRATKARADIVDRIRLFCDTTDLPMGVSVSVCDDGSPQQFAEQIERVCAETGATYLKTGRKHYQPFSLAIARNHAAQRSRAAFIMFMDVDLIAYEGFFEQLLREIEVNEMHEKIERFLMCPVIYLTNEGIERYHSLPTEMRRQYFIHQMLSSNERIIEKYSCGTSVIVVNRHYFLMRGGYDTRFNGWGYEDYEFGNRLIRRARQFPLPENWMKMDGNFMTIRRFEGWKSVYRMHGDLLAQKGMWMFHVPHPIDSSYHAHKDSNWRLLAKRMEEDSAATGEPDPLADLSAGRSLLLARNPFCYGREFAPFLGEVVFASCLSKADSIVEEDLIKKAAVERVVLSNPYANERSLTLYNWCRENEFPFVVCERGALPDSIYHDRTGFLSDGESYKSDKWDRPLSDEEIDAVEAYVAEIRWGAKMLEKQAERGDLHVIRKNLGLRDGQKMLLVPFQQPQDTTIRHFSGTIGSFENFYDLVSSLPQQLGEDWLLVYKKHPVEDDLAAIPGAKCGDEYNLYDLIELCDAMLVVNSGSGLYGMMFGKPVYIAGESWYSDERMNVPIKEIKEVAKQISKGFVPDYDKILRFIHYLRFEFYSFGEQIQRRVRFEDGSPITATTEIKYYEVRGFTPKPLILHRKFDAMRKMGPLFDRYALGSPGVKSALEQAQAEPTASAPKSAPTKPVPITAKSAKLRHDPRAFFRDAKNPVLRPLKHLFPKK